MPAYTENTTIGTLLEERPEAVEFFSAGARVQLDRFKDHELRTAAPYLGLTGERLQQLLQQVNKA